MSVSIGVGWLLSTMLLPLDTEALRAEAQVVTPTRGAGFVIIGSLMFDESGNSVSDAGDVNGDGLADVIVGAFTAAPNGQSSAGRSYVVFGKHSHLPVALSVIESGSSPDGFVINGSNEGDASGLSVSGAGDVNGDGLADVIVGAFTAAPNAKVNAGRSYVVFGKRKRQPVELSAIESGSSPDGFVINGSNGQDLSGQSVSGAGDINGDGLADVIVGAPGAYGNGLQGAAGRSYVVFGKRSIQPVELANLETARPSPSP
ncbi:integrin alpha [Gloeobacter kilaueensis]|uniref:integrin alpha n=1 Tax=Gloeobacter kilaueensis TaxID=1416614 RepID=UPI001FDF5D5D|nr:integrin alpha [Gloeobacter kilaueensis]